MSAFSVYGGQFQRHRPDNPLLARYNPFFPQDMRRGRKVVRLWPNFQTKVSKHGLWCDKDWLAWLDECEVKALDYFKRKVHQPRGHIQPKWKESKPKLEPLDPRIIAKYSMTEYEKQKRYRQRHKAAGLCVCCPQPVEPNRLYCKQHLGKRKEIMSTYNSKNKGYVEKYRSKHAALGLCMFCPRPVVKGHKCCKLHGGKPPHLDALREKEQALAAVMTSLCDLKLLQLKDIAAILGCVISHASRWKQKQMAKLLKED